MSNRPYTDGYLPVSRASDALRNQADTILDELHISITRAQDIRAKMKRRAEERARVEVCVAAWDAATKALKEREARLTRWWKWSGITTASGPLVAGDPVDLPHLLPPAF